MATYRVSPQALLDLDDIYFYIAVEKEAPLNARHSSSQFQKDFLFFE